MILHTLSSSPCSSDALIQCLRFCRPGDAILFMDDSVLALFDEHVFPEEASLHVCSTDLSDRGLDSGLCKVAVAVGDDSLVHSLAASAGQVIHWG